MRGNRQVLRVVVPAALALGGLYVILDDGSPSRQSSADPSRGRGDKVDGISGKGPRGPQVGDSPVKTPPGRRLIGEEDAPLNRAVPMPNIGTTGRFGKQVTDATLTYLKSRSREKDLGSSHRQDPTTSAGCLPVSLAGRDWHMTSTYLMDVATNDTSDVWASLLCSELDRFHGQSAGMPSGQLKLVTETLELLRNKLNAVQVKVDNRTNREVVLANRHPVKRRKRMKISLMLPGLGYCRTGGPEKLSIEIAGDASGIGEDTAFLPLCKGATVRSEQGGYSVTLQPPFGADELLPLDHPVELSLLVETAAASPAPRQPVDSNGGP